MSFIRRVKQHYFGIIAAAILIVIALASDYLPSVTGVGYLEIAIAVTSIPYNAFLAVSIGAVATILAISFSIAILAVQRAAETYSPSVLKYYKWDFETLFVIMFYLLTIIVGALSLIGAPVSQALNVTMFSISLILLVLQFIHTIDLVNPVLLIAKIQSETEHSMRSLPKEALVRTAGEPE